MSYREMEFLPLLTGTATGLIHRCEWRKSAIRKYSIPISSHRTSNSMAMEANNSNQWNRASSIVVIRIVMLPEPDTSLQCLSVSQVVCFCYLFIFLISASQLIGNIPSIGFKHLNHVCNSVHLVGFAVFKKVTALDQLPFSLLRLKFFSFFLFRFTSRFLMYDFVCSKMIL